MVASYVRSYDLMPPERWMIRLDPESETLGPILRRLREHEGWTLYQVAQRIYPEHADDHKYMKNKESLLSRYENNQMKNPDSLVLDRLEDLYGLPRDTLTLAHRRTQRFLRTRESIPEDVATLVIPHEPELAEIFAAVDPIEPEDIPDLVVLIRGYADSRRQDRQKAKRTA